MARECGELASKARDAAFVALGLSVLGVQKAQVRRRELARTFLEVDNSLGPILDRLDASLEPFAERISPSARAALGQARAAREHIRSFLRSAAA